MRRNNVIKVIISLSLAVIMLCSLTVTAFAVETEEPEIQPRWTSIATMDLDMAFVGNEGVASATARKQSTASRIEGVLSVFKWTGSRWEFIGDASGSKTVGTLGLSVYFECEQGVQYKAVFTVLAFTNGVAEDETIEYLETCR